MPKYQTSKKIEQNADTIMDKKTKRKFKKMFKKTNQRKQRVAEKRDTRRIVNDYINEQESDNHDKSI